MPEYPSEALCLFRFSIWIQLAEVPFTFMKTVTQSRPREAISALNFIVFAIWILPADDPFMYLSTVTRCKLLPAVWTWYRLPLFSLWIQTANVSLVVEGSPAPGKLVSAMPASCFPNANGKYKSLNGTTQEVCSLLVDTYWSVVCFVFVMENRNNTRSVKTSSSRNICASLDAFGSAQKTIYTSCEPTLHIRFCTKPSNRALFWVDASFDEKMPAKRSQPTDHAALIKKYDEFINLKLKPNLKVVLDSRDGIYDTISE